jgi:MFS family permease
VATRPYPPLGAFARLPSAGSAHANPRRSRSPYLNRSLTRDIPKLAARVVTARRGAQIRAAVTSDIALSLYLPAFTLAVGRGIAAPALPVYAKSFDIPFELASWVVIVYLLGTAISTVPTGMMLDRIGRRRIVLAGPILAAAMSLIIPFAQSFPELLVLRFLGGWAQGMWVLARLTIIADQGGDKRGRLITAMVAMEGAGSLIGPAVGGLIAHFTDVRVPFFVHGSLALLAVIPSFKLIHDPKPETARAQKQREEAGSGWLREVLVFQVVVIFLVQVFVQMSRASVGNGILDLYAVYAYGIGPALLGAMAAVATGVSLPITFMAGQVMDRFGRRKTIIPGFTLVGLSMLFMAYIAAADLPLPVYAVALVFAQVSQAVTHGSMQTLASDIAPSNARGKFFGLWRLVGESATFISPVMFTFFSSHGGFPASCMYLAISGFMAAALTLFFVKETLKRPTREALVASSQEAAVGTARTA